MHRLVLLLAIVLVGAALRLTGLDWDDGAHLHPDERYFTIVATAIDRPASVGEYLDVESSLLSPYNTESGSGYLYGQLPLFATKLVAGAIGRGGYEDVHLVGRALSALLDTVSIVLVFLVALFVLAAAPPRVRDAGALLAAAFYACSVTAIQHAHFFTMESWLVTGTLLSFWLAGRLALRGPSPGLPLLALAGLGAALGATAASKLSGLLVLLPIAVALAAIALAGDRVRGWHRALELGAALLVVVASAYATFRLVSPYAFAGSNWLDVRPNADFRAALESQQRALDGDFLFPPAYQWLLSDPWLDPLRNLVVWGLGAPLGLAALAGFGALCARLVQNRLRCPGAVAGLMLVVFVTVTFALFASRFAHSIRYLLPLVPFVCVAAACGIVALHARKALLARALGAGVLVLTLLYAVSFVAVYSAPNTRLAASAWLERHAKAGDHVVGEHWDDALPAALALERSELPVFDSDDASKLRKLHDGLAQADYYVLSSPRAWRTIGRLPRRFPLMVRFYDRLFAGELGFRRVARFDSPPRLLGIRLDDLGAEEPFWVYDHPRVLVLARAEMPGFAAFRAAICAGDPLPGCV